MTKSSNHACRDSRAETGQLPPFDTTGKLPLERPLNFDGIEKLAGQAAHSRLMGNI